MRQEIRTDRLCGGASMQAGSLRVSLLKPGGYCRAFCILRMRYCVRFDICKGIEFCRCNAASDSFYTDAEKNKETL